MDYETITYELSGHVATVTLNRPDRLNAFNQRMCDEFEHLWGAVRLDDDVRAIVLQAEGERAFSTGIDVREGRDEPENIWSRRDPGVQLGPKHNQVWKPVVAALHGMVAGGALYWVNESDIVICSDDATFFDPHVSYGLTAALEPIGLSRRVPLGEVLRMTLLGLDERMSAARAREIGLVSEVVSRADLRSRAAELAGIIAANLAAAVRAARRHLPGVPGAWVSGTSRWLSRAPRRCAPLTGRVDNAYGGVRRWDPAVGSRTGEILPGDERVPAGLAARRPLPEGREVVPRRGRRHRPDSYSGGSATQAGIETSPDRSGRKRNR
jgi:enoyl-CoA hydratase/carnithine racemase